MHGSRMQRIKYIHIALYSSCVHRENMLLFYNSKAWFQCMGARQVVEIVDECVM